MWLEAKIMVQFETRSDPRPRAVMWIGVGKGVSKMKRGGTAGETILQVPTTYPSQCRVHAKKTA